MEKEILSDLLKITKLKLHVQQKNNKKSLCNFNTFYSDNGLSKKKNVSNGRLSKFQKKKLI